MRGTLILKAQVVKRSVGKNQNEKEENFLDQKKIEEENLPELWYYF